MKFNVVLGLVATVGIMSTGVLAMPVALHESSLVVRGGGPGGGDGGGGDCGDGGYGGHGGDGDGGYGDHGGDGDGGYGDHGGGDRGDGGYGDGGHGGGRSRDDCGCYPPALIEVCISGLLDVCVL